MLLLAFTRWPSRKGNNIPPRVYVVRRLKKRLSSSFVAVVERRLSVYEAPVRVVLALTRKSLQCTRALTCRFMDWRFLRAHECTFEHNG